jgi:hypothetical protein
MLWSVKMNLTALRANWRTTVLGLIPLVAYALNYFGLWPASMPLPPLDQVWPFVFALFGMGVVAKDGNVTNAHDPSPPTTL